MHLDRIGVPTFETIDRRLSSVRGTVVGYPKDPIRGSIRFLLHDEIDQRAVTIDTSGALAQTKYFCPSNIPRRHVSQRSHSFVFKLNTTVSSRHWCGCTFQSMASLDSGFFIGRNNKIVFAQRASFPDPLIQIKDTRRFWFETRVSGPNPATVTPRPARDCSRMEMKLPAMKK